MINVFIGYDSREAVAFEVLSKSIHARASEPVSITPLRLSQLRNEVWRTRDPLQSTDFAFSRFLVPFLSEYKGWSIFMDCDMLMRDDIAKLWSFRDDRHSVRVVQHNHVPEETTKFLGQPQSAYAKKNWSSVMLFNNARCHQLTPYVVNSWTGLELHQFLWAPQGSIGHLPNRWNHLVDVQPYDPDAALVHYTKGGPWFEEYKDCTYAEEWRRELNGH